MAHRDWTYPDVDKEGFIPFELLKQQTRDMSLEQFLQEFPVPALLVVYREPEAGHETLDPTNRGVQLLTVSIKSTSILRYLGKIAFVTKRPGNLFGHLISVGRSGNNDITIAVDSVSKVHGYFVADGDQWAFTDHGSTNGSFLDDEALASGQKEPLKPGSLLRLGLEVTLEFLRPVDLYRKVHQD